MIKHQHCRPFGSLARLILWRIAFLLTLSSACLAQPWELGANGGFGWYVYPTITNSSGSVRAGVPAKGAIGVTLTENINNHIGGEINYLLRWGGPQLRFDGTQANLSGHTNAVTYDFLFYTVPHESAIRPFVSGGAGIKVYTGNGQRFLDINQPLANFALLRPITQVEPAISVGGGVKFTFANHAQVRIELRTYMTPLPDLVFRPTGLSKIRGWLYDFVPLGGISYVF
jgi:hypothetical protein